MLRWVTKSGTFAQLTIFIVFLVIFWIPYFVHPNHLIATAADGPLFTMLAGWLINLPVLSIGVALFLIVIQALLLTFVFQAYGFFNRKNFMPALIILMAYSWNGTQQALHALLPAGIFIIVALNSILSMYGEQAAYRKVFTASFSIGIASLFYFPLIYLMPFIWFSFVTYRVSTWREYIISIIGVALPYIYYFSWLFWNDNFDAGVISLSDALFKWVLPERLSLVNTVWLSFSTFMLVVAMVAVLNLMSDKLISLRRRAWVLFNYSFSSLLVLIMAGWPIMHSNYLFVFPLAFFLAGSLSLLKRTFWIELLTVLYFTLFVVMRLYMLI